VTVGENFKRIRNAKGIKQEQIYKQLGFQRVSNVSLLENSPRLPRAPTIKKMAMVLGCEPWELLEGVQTPYDELRLRTGKPTPFDARAPRNKQRRAGVGDSAADRVRQPTSGRAAPSSAKKGT
jgi:transcriptional regulator with XRE-family HTH domain